jgi:hypothetical protein
MCDCARCNIHRDRILAATRLEKIWEVHRNLVFPWWYLEEVGAPRFLVYRFVNLDSWSAKEQKEGKWEKSCFDLHSGFALFCHRISSLTSPLVLSSSVTAVVFCGVERLCA